MIHKILLSLVASTVASLVQLALSNALPLELRKPSDLLPSVADDGEPSATDRPASVYTDAAAGDLITDLPGLSYAPGFKQFSGYLTVSEANQRNIFYWYVESQNDPANDPVVFWTNGGPGCSGLLGFGTEHGPFFFGRDGTLSENPFSWNKAASILYVEQPAGVGFSFSKTESDYINVGDSRAAEDNYMIIRQFLERYPERKQNDFYISSESYGGHYIPQLAAEIMKKNIYKVINFRGFLVGNPYVDPFSNMVTQFEAYYSHGLLPMPVFAKWKLACSTPDAYNKNDEECDSLLGDLMSLIGRGINPYALDFPVCTENGEDAAPDAANSAVSAQGTKLIRAQTGGESAAAGPPFLPRQDNYHPCAEAHLSNYLNRDDVRKAIHASEGQEWLMCSDVLEYNMTDVATPQIDLYKALLKEASQKGMNLNMLVFSGDDDSICSTAGTQFWIYDVGVRPKDMWKPWKVQGQTSGYVTKFDLGKETDSTFTFATVHGAGHEVPAYRPKEALHLFKKFLSGEW